MLAVILAITSAINFAYADYKHVVSLAEAEFEIEPEPAYEIFEVTAYTLREEETGKGPDHPQYGITASGAYVQENHTIACPESMDFGTKIYIPELDNEFECQDRGGAITEGKLDVYMEKVEDALKFGRRKLEVAIY